MRSRVLSAALLILMGAAASAQNIQIQKLDPPPGSRDMATTMIQSFRSACANQDVATLTVCTTSGDCTTLNQPCFPYRCDAQARTCAAGCSSNDQCWTGTVCSEARCVVQRAWCEGGRYLKNTAGAVTDCWPYSCDEAGALCRTRCTVSTDCGSDTNCRPESGQCSTS
jgi:hypothetical protein